MIQKTSFLNHCLAGDKSLRIAFPNLLSIMRGGSEGYETVWEGSGHFGHVAEYPESAEDSYGAYLHSDWIYDIGLRIMRSSSLGSDQ